MARPARSPSQPAPTCGSPEVPTAASCSAPALPPASPAAFPPDRHAGSARPCLQPRAASWREFGSHGPPPVLVHTRACGDGLRVRASCHTRPRAHTGTSVPREASNMRSMQVSGSMSLNRPRDIKRRYGENQKLDTGDLDRASKPTRGIRLDGASYP